MKQHDIYRVRLRVVYLFLIIVLGGFIGMAVHLGHKIVTTGGDSLVYVKGFQIFKELFQEPFEVMVIIFDDWTGFAITTKDDGYIRAPKALIIEQIKKRGKGLEDILIIVHNHLDQSRFSETDDQFWHYMRRQGFNGFFLIYYPHSGKVLEKK